MADDKIPQVTDELDFDFGAKKKKKKKKVEGEEEKPEVEVPQAAPVTSAEPQKTEPDPDLNDLNDFSDKKKKKKKPKSDFDEEFAKPEEEKEKEDKSDLGDDLILEKKKKKTTKDISSFEDELRKEEAEFKGEESSSKQDEGDDHEIKFDSTPTPEDPWVGSERDYTYKEILDRAFRIIKQANPDSEGGKKRYTMIPPQVVKEGSKKTLFTNIAEICKRMHRQPEHVNSFLFSELGTTGSVDGNQMLVIKGRFQPTQIENVLRSYILEYVTCKICKSPDTSLTKENRLTFMQCHACGAKRSVANIKTGFSAQVDRRNKPQ